MKFHVFALAILISSLMKGSEIIAQEKLPSNFFLTKLDNGLEVLVIEDKSVPLVTVEIVVRNGAYCEDSNYNGLSHLYEHMFFKANKVLPSQEKFLDRVNELGVVFNGTTSDERVNYFITLNNSKVVEGLQFVNDAIRYPLFDKDEMKRENPVVDGEFQRAESSPVFFLFDDFNKAMWRKNYSRKNAIGNHDIILTATPEKMNIIKDKYYYPNNSMLVLAGDVEHEKMFEEAKKIYGSWKPSNFDPFEKYPIPEFEKITKDTNFITINGNAQVPMIIKGWHGPDTRNDLKSTYAADVFSTILGLQSSKFQQRLVESGLCYQVSMGYQTCKYVGPIQMFVVPNPAKLKEAYQAVLNEMNDFDSPDYFTEEQLNSAKNQLAISDAYDKERTSSFVHTVTYWWASASINYYTDYIDNINQVSRQDIIDYIQKYIKGKPTVSGLLLNKDMQLSMKLDSFDSLNK